MRLLENGTDLRYIPEIPGHKSNKAMEIYTHLSANSIQKAPPLLIFYKKR